MKQKIIKPICWVEKPFDIICVTLLVTMSCITTIDVIGRYAFNSPLAGAYESNELLLALLIFAALPRVTWYKQHLSVTLIDASLSPRSKKIQAFFLSLVSFICLCSLSFYLFLHALKLYEYGDMSPALQLPIYIFAVIISMFTAIAALASFVHLFYSPANTTLGA